MLSKQHRHDLIGFLLASSLVKYLKTIDCLQSLQVWLLTLGVKFLGLRVLLVIANQPSMPIWLCCVGDIVCMREGFRPKWPSRSFNQFTLTPYAFSPYTHLRLFQMSLQHSQPGCRLRCPFMA